MAVFTFDMLIQNVGGFCFGYGLFIFLFWIDFIYNDNQNVAILKHCSNDETGTHDDPFYQGCGTIASAGTAGYQIVQSVSLAQEQSY